MRVSIFMRTVLQISIFTINWFESEAARNNNADIDSLELVQVVFRHGDRTPYTQHPNDPLQNESLWYPYATGFQALTKKGMQMQYQLGKYLRRRYGGFLTNVYSQKEIFVQSSDRDRTIMSALPNLAGLWPPTHEDPKSVWNPHIAWQPIPVHAVQKSLDNFIGLSAPCPRFQQLSEEYLKRSPFALSINNNPDNQKLCEYVKQHSGLKECGFDTINGIWDTLMIQKSYNFALPAWVGSVYDEMAKLAPFFFDPRVVVPTDEAKRVKGGPLLNFLVRNMDIRRNSSDVPKPIKDQAVVSKMQMLSAHDSTIAVLLGTIGVFETQFPPYASAVFLEMHRGKGNHKNDHFVRVFLRNDTSVPPYEFKIPQCGYPCNLDDFKQLFSHFIVDGEEWKAACKPISSNAQKSADSSGYVSSI